MAKMFKKAQLVVDEQGSVFAATDSGRQLLKMGGGYGGYASYAGVAHTTEGNGANFSMDWSNTEGETPLLDTLLKSPIETGLYFVQLSVYPDTPLTDFSVAPDLILQLSAPSGNSIFAYATLSRDVSALPSPGSYPELRGATVSTSAISHISSEGGGAVNPQLVRGADGAGALDFYYNMTVVKLG